jgi:hypothetical protein
MTSHHTFTSACGFVMTVLDTREEKRRRARMFTAANWRTIAFLFGRMVDRTRASRESVSSFMVATASLATLTVAYV